jgi:hypothetical protein
MALPVFLTRRASSFCFIRTRIVPDEFSIAQSVVSDDRLPGSALTDSAGIKLFLMRRCRACTSSTWLAQAPVLSPAERPLPSRSLRDSCRSWLAKCCSLPRCVVLSPYYIICRVNGPVPVVVAEQTDRPPNICACAGLGENVHPVFVRNHAMR